MKKITIGLKEIIRGRKYTGTIEELGIEYELTFNILINKLEEKRIPYREDEQNTFIKKRYRYNFKIKKDGKEINEINDKLFIIMTGKVADMAIFYYEDNSVSFFNEVSEIIDGDDDESTKFEAFDDYLISDDEFDAIKNMV